MSESDLFGLKDTHVVITGASGGIGLATVKLFAKLGAKITAQCNSKTGGLEDCGPAVNTLQADATNEEQVELFFKYAGEFRGPPHVLVGVCHGIFESNEHSIAEMSVQQFRRTIDVNLVGTFLFVKHFLRNINAAHRPPTVVIVGSTAGRYGEAFHADYAASKSALHYGFLLSLKNEIVKFHSQGRANAVAPGWVSTPMALESLKNPRIRGAAMATTPLKKIATPEDVANTIAFLASSKLSGHISGEIITVAGGMEGRQLNPPESIQ